MESATDFDKTFLSYIVKPYRTMSYTQKFSFEIFKTIKFVSK